MKNEILKCECGAKARNTSKERGRFKARYPKLCTERAKNRAHTKQNAASLRAVYADAPESRE